MMISELEYNDIISNNACYDVNDLFSFADSENDLFIIDKNFVDIPYRPKFLLDLNNIVNPYMLIDNFKYYDEEYSSYPNDKRLIRLRFYIISKKFKDYKIVFENKSDLSKFLLHNIL